MASAAIASKGLFIRTLMEFLPSAGFAYILWRPVPARSRVAMRETSDPSW